MKKYLFIFIGLILASSTSYYAAEQSCTPYQVGGFTLGKVPDLKRPDRLRCAKQDPNSKCIVRRHKFTKNGFKYEVLLTADTFRVISITGENKELTGNDEDFTYFEGLMVDKYSAPTSNGEFYTYYYPQSTNPFGSGLRKKYIKDKKVAESWQNHICWGKCPTKSIDINGPRTTERVNYKGQTIKNSSLVYAKGKVLDSENSSGLYLNSYRTAKKQKLTISADCPALADQIEKKSLSDNRTGEF